MLLAELAKSYKVIAVNLSALAKVYRAIYLHSNSLGCKVCVAKSGSFAESRYFTIMFSLVELQWRDYHDEYITNVKYFIDVGAASNTYYTIRACKLNSSIKIIAIEPLPIVNACYATMH
jgi:hypothetical protein